MTMNAAMTAPMTAVIPSHVPTTYSQRLTALEVTLYTVRRSTSEGTRLAASASASTIAAANVSESATSR